MAVSKTLVVYYSRTGTTRKVAQMIAAALGAEIEEIRETTSRSGVIGYLQACYDAIKRRSAPIVGGTKNPANYDLVVIGTPVWVSRVPPPVRSYIATAKDRLPAVAFFCTLGGNGAAATLKQMEGLAGKAPRASCAIMAHQLARGLSGSIVDGFVKGLTTTPVPAKASVRVFPDPVRA